MWRSLAALVFVLAAACQDDTLKPPSSGTPFDPVADDADGGADPAPVAPTAWGDPTTTRRSGIVRLAQLNVRRFFDTKCDSGSCASGGFEDVATPKAFADRTAQLAAGIARLEADVVTLDEVENQVCVDALAQKLKDAGYVYPIAKATDAGGPGNVNVAVLARGTLDGIDYNRASNPLVRPDGSRTTFTRELPAVRLSFGKSKAVVFAAHFHSKVNDDPGRRLAEAQKAHDLVAIAASATPSAIVLLAGDLNDTPASPPLDALESDGELLRIAKELAPEAQGTITFQGTNQAIDHVFTAKDHAASYVAKSVTIVRDGNATTGGFAGSDHAAIYADFQLP